MDPKRPTSPLMAAPDGSSASRGSSASARAKRDDEGEVTPTRPGRKQAALTLVKTAPTNAVTAPPSTQTALPQMTPGADAETVMVLERLRALCPALEFPFGAQRFDADAFFALPETPDDSRCYELIDGVVVVSPSVLPTHSFFTLNLLVALFQVTRERGLGPIFSEVDVSPNPQNVLRPDMMWYGELPTDDETLSRRLIGVIPWVVLETLSESTKKYDQVEKRRKYEQMGVKEYWILNPKKKWLEVHHFASGRVTRLEQPEECLTTDLLPGWRFAIGALFDPTFDPYAEKTAALLAEYEEKRQALKDAFEDAEERRAQAEARALEETQRREQAEAAAKAEAELRQRADELRQRADELRQRADERREQAEVLLGTAQAAIEAERHLRLQETQLRTQAERERAEAVAREAALLARLELLERSHRSGS